MGRFRVVYVVDRVCKPCVGVSVMVFTCCHKAVEHANVFGCGV